jgi:hypothetical protein
VPEGDQLQSLLGRSMSVTLPGLKAWAAVTLPVAVASMSSYTPWAVPEGDQLQSLLGRSMSVTLPTWARILLIGAVPIGAAGLSPCSTSRRRGSGALLACILWGR